MAIFLDAPPYYFLCPLNRPCASTIWRSAFPAEKQFSQCILSTVFALLSFCADLFDLPLTGTPCPFFLHSAEGGGVNDGGMVVFHIVFGALAVVNLYLFGKAVGNKCLVYNRIALVSLIGKD